MSRNDGVIIVEDAKIQWLNFSGNATQFNDEGKRNFCLFLDHETAARLVQDGWNVKQTKPREEGDIPEPYLQVVVKYKNRLGEEVQRPPRVIMIGETSRKRTELTEDVVGVMDSVDIVYVDVAIRPNRWEVNGKTGINAYLKSMYATIEEDYLDLKYANEEIPLD